MQKFFKSLVEVNVAIKFYKRLAMLCVVALVVVCIAVLTVNQTSVEKERRSIYTLDVDGDLLPMVRSTVMEKRPIEAAAHVRLLLTYLFDIDKLTYKDKLKRAYDLGNKSIYAIYVEQEQSGWYVDVEQYNAHSALVIRDLRVVNPTPPYVVNAAFSVIINSDITKNKRYDLEWDITVENGAGERLEKNPHDMVVVQIVKRKFDEVEK
ncbi:MAG: hypothetical protein LBK47_08030 [Prevotellaceae bacterium]|jgi:hypothetical protein|nr:hypothetical protein [Prevotellaceae bacterium]